MDFIEAIMEYKISDILKKITYLKFIGDENSLVKQILPIDKIQDQDFFISWVNDKNIDKIYSVASGCIICSQNVQKEKLNRQVSIIIASQPKTTFGEVINYFFLPDKYPQKHISPSATIGHGVTIGENVYIGHNTIVEEGCKIGSNVFIGHNNIIHYDTIIGSDVKIGSNNTIGGWGFGYSKNEQGNYQQVPHIGNVVIADYVDIGNNNCIDRAVLGSTVIGKHVKIDNLIHIAHNVEIGENTMVIANAMIGGSTKIGANSWIAPSASLLNKLTIGSGSVVGMGAVVIKNVGDNEVVAGNPSRFIKKNTT